MTEEPVSHDGGNFVLQRGMSFSFAILLILSFLTPPLLPSTDTIFPSDIPNNATIPNAIDSSTGYFIENMGQVNNRLVRFYAQFGDMAVGFSDNSVLIKIMEDSPVSVTESESMTDREPMRRPAPESSQLPGVLLRINFEGANMVNPYGRDALPYSTNFFTGGDPSHWRTEVRSYREIVYGGLYDGVDLVYRANSKGVKYDFIIDPGVDLGIIRISYEGAESIGLDAAGNLIIHTAIGDIVDSSPIAYQDGNDVQCTFVKLDLLSFGFSCNGVDNSRKIVIDPLIYSTYLGGGGMWDEGWSITTDIAGNTYVTGYTQAVDFPITTGAFNTTLKGEADVFIAKLNPTGSSLLYSTYLGGGNIDQGFSITIDSNNNAYVTGYTYSSDFPVTPGAINTALSGVQDAFVVKLDSTGGSLLYSTYLGGSDSDEGDWIALDIGGDVYVVGSTHSTNFPTTPGALDTTLNGSEDIFVAKLDPTSGSLLYSTYLGGGDIEAGFSIAIDSSSNAYVTGYTDSADFPITPDAFDKTLNDGTDLFVTKLDSTGSTLLYSTYLGGDSSDVGLSITIDSNGNAYISGSTRSTNFPVTSGAFSTTLNGWQDAFVVKLNFTSSTLLYSTYLGGSIGDIGFSITIDSTNNLFMTGFTSSADFPVTSDAFDKTLSGPCDAFIVKLNSTGSSLLYSTYLGGGNGEYGRSITIDLADNIYVTGFTDSTDFPVTVNAFDTTLNGWEDIFVVKLNLSITPPPTELLQEYWWIIVIIIVVLIVLLSLLMVRKKKTKEEDTLETQTSQSDELHR